MFAPVAPGRRGLSRPYAGYWREEPIPAQDLTVVAEGDAPGGARWYLKAGGSADDYYTPLQTVHPDGRRDDGGMGGPVLYPGRLVNVYTGRADPGLLRVIVRPGRWNSPS